MKLVNSLQDQNNGDVMNKEQILETFENILLMHGFEGIKNDY